MNPTTVNAPPGTPLFPADASLRRELPGSESTGSATHLRYRVVDDV